MSNKILTAIKGKSARDRLAEVQSYIDFQSTTIPLYNVRKELKEETIELRVIHCGDPQYHRLCYAVDDNDNKPEEAVFTLDGYITDHSLPPITKCDQLAKKPLWCQQSVNITGYGDKSFTDACLNLADIAALFEASLPQGDINMYEHSNWQSYNVMTVSNHYFTQQRFAKHDLLAPLKQSIDPHGFLYNFARTSTHPLVNIKENRVKYYERVFKEGDTEFSTLFSKCEPSRFEIGDMVKLDFSFIMFSSAGRNNKEVKHTVTPILRAVYLLDSEVKQNAGITVKQRRKAKPVRLLKRTLSIQMSDDSDSDHEQADKRRKL